MTVDMRPAAVGARLREVGSASDLRAGNRLACKVDMSAAAITRRLRLVAALARVCLMLGRAHKPKDELRGSASAPALPVELR